jgi:Ca2+:H+ antiporter
MIVLYILGLIYSLRSTDGPLASPTTIAVQAPSHDQDSVHAAPVQEIQPVGAGHHPSWSLRATSIILALATIGVAFMSELLISTVEPVVISLGVSEFFLGIILIPLIGNVAEHLVALKVAVQNQMDLSVEISLASSLQIALFVAPVLVFISLIMGNPMLLIFNEFELLALIAGVIIAVFVAEDGKSNWLEGAELLAVYLILALAFFLLPK